MADEAAQTALWGEAGWPRPLSAWPARRRMTTRWRDNDVYGHLNNTVAYELFDAAVNADLIEAGLLRPADSPVHGIVAETACRYLKPLHYPAPVTVAFGVGALGRRSVIYHLALYGGDEDAPAALGRFVHVYVGRRDGRPRAIPPAFKRRFEALILGG